MLSHTTHTHFTIPSRKYAYPDMHSTYSKFTPFVLHPHSYKLIRMHVLDYDLTLCFLWDGYLELFVCVEGPGPNRPSLRVRRT